MSRNVCRVDVIPDGPALLRGADAVRTADGQEHAVTRPVVAVCMCGRTQREPWCDGTHKAVQRAARLAAQADDD